MMIKLREIYRRIMEADFPWHKFPAAGRPADPGQMMGKKGRDVSKIGPQHHKAAQAANPGPGDKKMWWSEFKSKNRQLAKDFYEKHIEDAEEYDLYIRHDAVEDAAIVDHGDGKWTATVEDTSGETFTWFVHPDEGPGWQFEGEMDDELFADYYSAEEWERKYTP